MTESHPFDRALALEIVDAETVRGRTHPAWANMIGPFGGITAAVLLRAVDLHPDRLGQPVVLTVNFAAPIADGEFEISRRAARTNRTNQHWILELSQDGDIKTTATAVFGIRRDTWSDVEAAPPEAPLPEDVVRSSYENFPHWFRLYDMRFTEGYPADGALEPAESSTSTLWARDVAERPVDYPAIAALSDVFFPRIFLRRGLVASGTISLTTYFHVDQERLDALGSDFILCTAHANGFDRGFFDQRAQLWSREGALIATTYQLAYFKA